LVPRELQQRAHELERRLRSARERLAHTTDLNLDLVPVSVDVGLHVAEGTTVTGHA
jgi:hypothetical protein